MPDDVLRFYQQLARDYHLIFADWNKAIERQGSVLDRLIRVYTAGPPLDVLDCSCGIGTQAIGLAGRGYRVHATDLSPAAVERATEEARTRGLSITFGVADMRRLETQVEGDFDVVLSCDNALPHLLTDDDLHLAVCHMRSRLRDSGLLLISIRDYDHLIMDRPPATTPQVFDDNGGRRIVFQVWDWADQTYTVHMFILREGKRGWRTSHYATTYRALLRAELSALLESCGFADIRWYMPQDTGYYQPVVIARSGA
jgi:glycine/sarcosine N-methyltransferase